MADTTKHLLIVEDEAPLREVVAERLADQGFDVVQAANGEEALERLAEFAFDIVITDLRLPGIDGGKVLEAAIARYPDIIGIVVTGYGTVKDAVEAIKRGATDFVTKPFQFDELLHALDSALEQRRLRSENAYLRSQLERRYSFTGIIGRSRPMRDLFQLLETVSGTSSTILVTGETGTGKELVARAIHHNSPRAQRSVRGAQLQRDSRDAARSRAVRPRARGVHRRGRERGSGRFELAHKGTLLLDEVGTMGGPLQMKLLRALQEREVERVGDSRPIKVDVRVIAATNSDLARLVAEGKFREDLYYRLNVIPVQAAAAARSPRGHPAARAALSRAVLPRARARRRPPMTVSQQAMRRLMAYAWPGNVRQLENALERAVALGAGRTQIETGRSSARRAGNGAVAHVRGVRAARGRDRSPGIRHRHRARADPSVARARPAGTRAAPRNCSI